MNTCKIILFLVIALIHTSFAQNIAPLPVSVLPDDANIRYVGRFTSEKKPRCSWSASAIEIRFDGTDLQAKFNEQGKDFWHVIIDGKPTSVLTLTPGEALYTVAQGLPKGEHTIQLVKRTEAFVGITRFLGFYLSEGSTLLTPTPPTRRMEVIGDSISCGFGNESNKKEDPFKPETENANIAYGAIAARILNADYQCIAWSGRKMWPDNTTVSIYDAILPADATAPKWDYSKYIPDVIVINLATNDFSKGVPEEEGWTGAYVDFIKRLRGYYPNAHIYCMLGSMMNDNWPPEVKALSKARSYVKKIIATTGDEKVHFFEAPPQDGAVNGIGAAWHPSAKTHQLMGEKLADTIKKDLSW